MAKTEKQKQKRRYNLHYILRKKGYKVDTAKKTISVDRKAFENKDYPKTINKYFSELSTMGYGIQSKMF